MNELITIEGNKPVTTSLKVAEVFGKKHKNVIQAIESLDCPNDFTELNFQPSEYKDATGRILKSYIITKDGFTLLAMGFTGEKAMQFKIAYIKAFNEKEEMLKRAASGDYSMLADELFRRQMNAMRSTIEENVQLKHEVSFLEHFKPQGQPGEIARSGLPKTKFRRGFYCSKNGRDAFILQHPKHPDLFEAFEIKSLT